LPVTRRGYTWTSHVSRQPICPTGSSAPTFSLFSFGQFPVSLRGHHSMTAFYFFIAPAAIFFYIYLNENLGDRNELRRNGHRTPRSARRVAGRQKTANVSRGEKPGRPANQNPSSV